MSQRSEKTDTKVTIEQTDKPATENDTAADSYPFGSRLTITWWRVIQVYIRSYSMTHTVWLILWVIWLPSTCSDSSFLRFSSANPTDSDFDTFLYSSVTLFHFESFFDKRGNGKDLWEAVANDPDQGDRVLLIGSTVLHVCRGECKGETGVVGRSSDRYLCSSFDHCWQLGRLFDRMSRSAGDANCICRVCDCNARRCVDDGMQPHYCEQTPP